MRWWRLSMSVTGAASFGFNLREFRWSVRKIVREREVVWVFPWRVPFFCYFMFAGVSAVVREGHQRRKLFRLCPGYVLTVCPGYVLTGYPGLSKLDFLALLQGL